MSAARRCHATLMALYLVLVQVRLGHAQPTDPARKGAAPADAQSASVPPEVQLERGVQYFETAQFSACVDAFADLFARSELSRALSRASIENARIYYAACLIALGKDEAADEEFRAAIRANPQIAIPSSVVFPQAVVDRFILVRAAMLDEIRKAQEQRAEEERAAAEQARRQSIAEKRRIEELERLAAEETIIVKNERWMASVPFGIGQFQNRDYVLGAVFLTSEVLLAATALTAVSIQLSLHSQAEGGTRLTQDLQEDLNRNLDTAHVVSLAATGGFIATALAGVLEAHLSFVPEYRDGIRRRSPGEVRIRQAERSAVTLTPALGIGAVGLKGQF